MHSQMERRIAAALFGQEVQEVPLRHHRDEPASCPEVGHIGQYDFVASDPAERLGKALMRQFQQCLQQSQFMHHFKRRGMNRVATEIAQEIGVLLQHRDLHSGPRQQIPQHDSGGAATRDTACSRRRGGFHALDDIVAAAGWITPTLNSLCLTAFNHLNRVLMPKRQ